MYEPISVMMRAGESRKNDNNWLPKCLADNSYHFLSLRNCFCISIKSTKSHIGISSWIIHYYVIQTPNLSYNSLFLVTGGAGFIVSNLCEAILNLGYRGRCLDDLSTGKQADADLFVSHPNCGSIKGGIKDLWTRI